MKTSAIMRSTYKKRKLGKTASNIGATFAAVAVVVSTFNQPVAELIALSGVVTDFGVRMVIKAVKPTNGS